MAEKKAPKEGTENVVTAVAVKPMKSAEVIQAFEGVMTKGVPLTDWELETSNLLSLAVGITYIILVEGLSEGVNKEGEVFDVVEGKDEKGFTCQVGDKMVVGTIERAIQNGQKFPWFYAIHWDGTVKEGKGKYKMVHVKKCPQSPEEFISK